LLISWQVPRLIGKIGKPFEPSHHRLAEG